MECKNCHHLLVVRDGEYKHRYHPLFFDKRSGRYIHYGRRPEGVTKCQVGSCGCINPIPKRTVTINHARRRTER